MKEKKTSNKKKIMFGVSAIVALVIIAITGTYVVAHYFLNKVNYENVEGYEIKETSDLDEDEGTGLPEADPSDVAYLEGLIDENIKNAALADSKDVRNILVIGCDTRTQGGGGRSDSMILVSINTKTNQIISTSFLRDIYLQIPGLSAKNRLNAAYSYGGAGLLIDTIEQNFKVKIDNYVAIDFFAFMEIIDATGGVTLNVSAAEINVMNNYISELNKLLKLSSNDGKLTAADAGTIHLSGKQALAYSRVRYVGNADFERTSRQRKVMEATFQNVENLGLTKLMSLLDDLLPAVTTDMPESTMLRLMMDMKDYKNYDIVQWSIPYENKYTSLNIRGMQVLGIDFNVNINQLQTAIYGTGN
ncbi:LCP family protein [Parasporobacterium paucivorans]|uniref:Transcriptional attenuator, LytR family n=1 Tax=Parasporobacterium paucivorans DSM 15970 TaxID=1122934 RepID=A0A1M6EB00_9FIRM|nr:LCP family protein [Parasporobacterium paucivorans]SHI82635.1 transcriptional attenuator, LytR family [Parasporobacterium paucivorans DSM 15970]